MWWWGASFGEVVTFHRDGVSARAVASVQVLVLVRTLTSEVGVEVLTSTLLGTRDLVVVCRHMLDGDLSGLTLMSLAADVGTLVSLILVTLTLVSLTLMTLTLGRMVVVHGPGMTLVAVVLRLKRFLVAVVKMKRGSRGGIAMMRMVTMAMGLSFFTGSRIRKFTLISSSSLLLLLLLMMVLRILHIPVACVMSTVKAGGGGG